MPHFLKTTLCVALLWIGQAACVIHAEQDDPVLFMQEITDSLLSEVRKNHTEVTTNTGKLDLLVQEVLFPHIDFQYMSRWVVGRTAWLQASRETQNDFVQAFQALLLRTYSNILLNYADQQVVYVPLRQHPPYPPRIQVQGLITHNGERLAIHYRLLRSDQGSWKVYDMVVEGVSLLKGFQSQFNTELQQEGLASLVSTLKEHNQEAQSKHDKAHAS